MKFVFMNKKKYNVNSNLMHFCECVYMLLQCKMK